MLFHSIKFIKTVIRGLFSLDSRVTLCSILYQTSPTTNQTLQWLSQKDQNQNKYQTLYQNRDNHFHAPLFNKLYNNIIYNY